MKYNIRICGRFYRTNKKGIARLIEIYRDALESVMVCDLDNVKVEILNLPENVTRLQYFDNTGKVVFSINQI